MAERWLGALGDRWVHVQGVGGRAESLGMPSHVVRAAWLHDIGYAPSLAITGFHPLDGARFLTDSGEAPEVTGLVAHHSGAAFEAEERGLAEVMAEWAEPDPDDLDLLNFLDLTTGPDGEVVSVEDRVAEILARYTSDDPVHRAVTRSGRFLVASARRGQIAMGLADVGSVPES